MSASTPPRPPITCHVLDTTTGRPAANLNVQLVCNSLSSVEFAGTTNVDGRITEWKNKQGPNGTEGTYVQQKKDVIGALKSIIKSQAAKEGDATRPVGSSLWKLTFDTGAHYGVENTFFPVVELSFLVVPNEHFHVPLLLGPYSFTTYRGS